MMRALRAAYGWLDDRLGISDSVMPVVEHPVPREINWWYVFGSATLVAFIVQVVTGVALAFAYVPAPNSAYESLQWITHTAVLGSVVRGIHYFGASAMVILIFIHMVRTFLMGAFKYPREMSWLTGVLLFVFTLGMAFTGQLLRWNQDAYWAVVVGAAQAARTPVIGNFLVGVLLAGQTVGGATLTRFYATHVFLIPAAMFVLIAVHLYLIVRHGISEPPVAGRRIDRAHYREWYHRLMQTDGVPFWPDAAWRDVVFALAIGAVVVGLSIAIGPADLGEVADPTNLRAYPRPDWYFLWYFALLALIPEQAESWVIIGFPALIGVILFALPFAAPLGERHPRRRPWAVGAIGLAVLGIAVLLRLGIEAPWSPDMNPNRIPASITSSLSPAGQRGAMLFMSRGCQNCHLVGGQGGERGPDLSTVGGRLTRDQLVWRVLYGGNGMPAYGQTLTPAETSDVVDFLSSLTPAEHP
jgi:ubiquinol-cytochrome c reductase cytochrome b subunit